MMRAPSAALRGRSRGANRSRGRKDCGGALKVYGTNVYPDATFTLRLNYGIVQGWVEQGTPVAPFTYLDRAFERATGATPLKYCQRIKAKDQTEHAYAILHRHRQ